MKKILLLAVTFVATASFVPAQAGDKSKKNKKKQATEQCCQPAVTLTTVADSASYVAGMAMTDGLKPFLEQQLKVDSAHMADFLRGFCEARQQLDDKAYNAYAAGLQVAQMAQRQMLPSVDKSFDGSDITISRELFFRGFADAVVGDTTLFTQSAAASLFHHQQAAVQEAKVAAQKKAGADFLAANAVKEGVKTTPSGLQYKVLRQGTGAVPTPTDEVVVKYEGHLIDGTIFDSSYKRDPQTNTFRANLVIKGWTEALTMMPVGSKWELYIPEDLAYGSRQAGQIPPYSTLIFTVELDDIKKP